jgi:hypothetical protein
VRRAVDAEARANIVGLLNLRASLTYRKIANLHGTTVRAVKRIAVEEGKRRALSREWIGRELSLLDALDQRAAEQPDQNGPVTNADDKV